MHNHFLLSFGLAVSYIYTMIFAIQYIHMIISCSPCMDMCIYHMFWRVAAQISQLSIILWKVKERGHHHRLLDIDHKAGEFLIWNIFGSVHHDIIGVSSAAGDSIYVTVVVVKVKRWWLQRKLNWKVLTLAGVSQCSYIMDWHFISVNDSSWE